eukprot:jgi/Chlat1/5347/Chrsp35S05278
MEVTAAGTGRRDKFKAVPLSATRRREQAATVSRERRDALLRARRLRTCSAEDDDAEDAAMEVAEAAGDDCRRAVGVLREAKGQSAQVAALKTLRRILSRGSDPPLQVAVEAGAVPLLLQHLAPSSSGSGWSEECALEVAWCLTNIACGAEGCVEAVAPAVPLLATHLGASSAPLAEQAAWALGNLAGDSGALRSALRTAGAVPGLVELVRRGSTVSPSASVAKTAAWALSNAVKKPGGEPMDVVRLPGALPMLVSKLSGPDNDLAVEVAWVLAYVTAEGAGVGEAMRSGLVPATVALLVRSVPALDGSVGEKERGTITPVLRVLGNIVAGPDVNSKAVIGADPNVIPALCRCLLLPHRGIQKEAAWVLSNIAACADPALPATLVSAGAVPPLLQLLESGALDVRREAAFALANLCAAGGAGNVDHLRLVVQGGALKDFCALVRAPDPEVARHALQFLELVLRVLPGGPQAVEEVDGIDAIESVQFHENEELQRMSAYLVDTYFGEDYGVEDAIDYDRPVADDMPNWRRPLAT